MHSGWIAIALSGAILLPQLAAAEDAPPPRSVNALKSQLTAARRASQADVSKADLQPPQGAAAADLARFYQTRAQAAEAVGRDAQGAADHRLALKYAREANLPLTNYLQALAFAEFWVLNFPAAKALAEESLKLAPPQSGWLFGPLFNLSLVHLRLGDMKQAERFVTEAERLLKEAETWRGEARRWLPSYRSGVFQARGRYFAASGRLVEAEAAFRLSLKEQEEVIRSFPGEVGHQQGIELRLYYLADTLVKQGRLVEAESELRRAIDKQIERGLRGAVYTSNFVGALADIIAEQGRFAEAEALAREAENGLVAALGTDSKSGALANARMRVARFLALRGKPKRAGEIFAQVVDARGGNATEILSSGLGSFFDPILLLALARVQQGASAETLSRGLLDQRMTALGEKAYDVAELRGFLGAVLWMQGKKDEALAAFRQAVPVLLDQGARGEDQIAKGLRFQAILEAYLALLYELKASPSLKGTDIAAETFQLAEAARGRSVQRAVAASAARVAAGDPALAELVRREQDLERRVTGLHGSLMEPALLPTDQQVPGAQAALRADIAKLTA